MNKIASKKLVIIALMLILLVSALSACVQTEEGITFKSVSIEQNGQVVQKIAIVEGSKIDYAAFSLRLTLSDGSSKIIVMTEAVFLPKELTELYSLKGGNSKGMTILYIEEGRVARGLITVDVNLPEVIKETFTVFFFMEENYADSVTFPDQPGVEKITTLPPTTHSSLKEYQKIVWYVSNETSNPNNLLENKLPLPLTANISLYGVVVDLRSYTVRFWKDAKKTSQIGSDIQAKYGSVISVPKEGSMSLDGYSFLNKWTYQEKEVSLGGLAPNQTVLINFDATSYPKTQVIDLIGVYSLNEYRISLFECFGVRLPDGTVQKGEASPIGLNGLEYIEKVKYNNLLQFGTVFQLANGIVTLPVPPAKTGYTAQWYLTATDVNGVQSTHVFSENHGAQQVRSNIVLTAVYIKNEYTVTFRNYLGEQVKQQVVKHGEALIQEDVPQLTDVDLDKYTYHWDAQSNLYAPVLGNWVIKEVRTPKDFKYHFVMSDGTELFAGISAYDAKVPLPTKDDIKQKLQEIGKDWFAYFDYGWYQSVGGSLVGATVQQPAGDLTLYLGYVDTRTYTVNYYYQLSGTTAVASNAKLFSETLKFAETARYAGGQVAVITGWEPKAVHWALLNAGIVSAAGAKIIDGTEFVPSDWLQTTYTAPEVINVVIMYERRVYTLTLNENFSGLSTTEYLKTQVIYETVLDDIDAIANYDSTDRVMSGQTYRFYGWADGSGIIVDTKTKLSGNMTLTAQWVSLVDGSFGLAYEVTGTGADRYATVVGYNGVSTELIIGSRYYDQTAQEYITVKKINWIKTDPNKLVTKIKLPDTVEWIQQGAFEKFYLLKEVEISTAAIHFTTENGVLYNKAKTELILYPILKADNAFTLPASVTKILNSAMVGFMGNSLTLNAELKEIGNNALSSSYLTSIALPDGLEVIGDNAFSGSKALLNVSYNGSSLTKIGINAFDATSFIAQKVNGMVVLGGKYLIRAYYGIAAELTLDDTILGIAAGAFAQSTDGGVQQDTGLKLLNIQSTSNLKFIGDNALLQCFELIAVNIGARSEVIAFGDGVFNGGVSAFRIYTENDATLDLFNAAYADTEYEGLFFVGAETL